MNYNKRKVYRSPITDFSETKQKMLNWLQQFNIFCFLDNHQYQRSVGGFECLAGCGAREILSKTDQSPVLPQLEAFLRKDWIFGHLGYGLCSETESIQLQHIDQIGFSDLFLFIPEIVIRMGTDSCSIETIDIDPELVWQAINNTVNAPGTAQTDGLSVQQRFTREEYIETVQQLQQHILRGDCYEINFCQEFYIDNCKLSPLSVYKSLSRESPNPFSVFYRNNDQHVACASPERYLRKKGRQIWSQPIKGTSKRDLLRPESDQQKREYLHQSEKEKAENVMVVDIVRNDLARVCEKGSVEVEELFGIYSFPQVHQMISTITGLLRKDVKFSDIVQASFPMASMTGAPKKRVMELIEQYERTARGLFSGAVGYIDPQGDFDFNVVIRSVFYNQHSQYLSFLAGSGITFYSDAALEWEECLLKAEAIKKVLAQGQH